MLDTIAVERAFLRISSVVAVVVQTIGSLISLTLTGL